MSEVPLYSIESSGRLFNCSNAWGKSHVGIFPGVPGRTRGGSLSWVAMASAGRGGCRRVQRVFRGGLVFKAHILCVSPNSRLESNKERESRFAESTSVNAHVPPRLIQRLQAVRD